MARLKIYNEQTAQWEYVAYGVPGEKGDTGDTGPEGPEGPAGEGVPDGGLTGQVLTKQSDDDFDTDWEDPSGGVWGSITGDIEDQTDLMNTINSAIEDVQENIEYTEYTFNSSGIKKGSRHNDWTELMAAVVAQGTPCRITFEQDETLPAGTWKIKDVVWRGNGLPAGNGGPLIYLSEGFYFGDTTSITFDYGLGVVNTASHFNLSVNHSLRVNMTSAAIASASGVEMFEITGSGSLGIMFVGDGASLSSFGMGPAVKYGAGTVGPVVFSGVNPDMMSDTISGHSSALILYIFGTQTFSTNIFAVTQPNFAGTIMYRRSDSRYVGFDPTGTGLTQPSVQGAIAELDSKTTTSVNSLQSQINDVTPPTLLDSDTIEWDRTAEDTSVYFTEGRTTVGGSSQGSGSSRKIAYLYTTTRDLWLDRMLFRARVAGGTSKVKPFIYANNSGAPGALITVGAEVTITNTSMNVYTSDIATNLYFPAGSTFWIGLVHDANGSQFHFSHNNVSNGRIRTNSGGSYGSEPTNPFLASYSTENGQPDIWLGCYGLALAPEIIPASTGKFMLTSDDGDVEWEAIVNEPKQLSIQVTEYDGALATGDGKAMIRVPSSLNGMNLISVGASVVITSSSGNPNIQIARGRQSSPTSAHSFVDMLSTPITIDATEYDSKDATTAAVINTSNNDLATGDIIRIDVDGVGTGSKGLAVTMVLQEP